MGAQCSRIEVHQLEAQVRTAEATNMQLNLSGNQLAPEAGVELAIYLEATTITHLNLAKNLLGDHGCSAIAAPLPNNYSIHRLVLSENDIGDHGVSDLVDAMLANRHVKELDLYGNRITHKGAASLSRLLRYTHHLESLLLGSNQVGDKGVRLLCNGCKLNHKTKMHRLGLSANGLSDVGAMKVWHMVDKYCHTLTTVEIGFNPLIEDRALLDLIQADCQKNKEFSIVKAWKHDTKNRNARKRHGTIEMLEPSQIAEFKEGFRMLDRDNDGTIQADELRLVL
jgi:Ran GTPase-activating protein (RanGAP) involved in mRNA processing and transport